MSSSSSSAPTIPCSLVEAASFHDGSWIINDFEPIDIENPLHAYLWSILSNPDELTPYTSCSKAQRDWCKNFGIDDKVLISKNEADEDLRLHLVHMQQRKLLSTSDLY